MKVGEVLNACSRHFDIPKDELLNNKGRSTTKGKSFIDARHIALYLIYKHCGYSLTETGKLFGGSQGLADHAVSKLEKLRDTSSLEWQNLLAVEKLLAGEAKSQAALEAQVEILQEQVRELRRRLAAHEQKKKSERKSA